MRDHHFRFELGQSAWCALGEVKILGRTKFLVPESYLVELDGEQCWLAAGELFASPMNTN